MNILIVSPGVYPVPAIKGGAVEKLIEILIKNDEITKKHNITVYTVYDVDIEKAVKNIHCNFRYIKTRNIIYQFQRIVLHIINRLSKKYIGNQYINKVKKDIKKSGKMYDAIIVENEPQYGLILKEVKQNAKMILHLHNDYLNEDVTNANKMYDSYDEIWTISKFIGNRVNKLKSDMQKVKIFYNGVDSEKFDTINRKTIDIRKKYNLTESNFIFMYAGRIAKEKGIEELIEAFNQLNNKNAKLLIVGGKQKGQERFYKKIMREISRNRNIIYVGYIDYEHLYEVYNIADVGIIPSVCNEAFGLTAIEFMNLGKPIIISDKGALKEISGTGKNVSIVPYNDEFVDNLKNEMIYFLNLEKDKFIDINRKSIDRAKKYTKDIYVKNFLALVEEEKNEKK